jgi:hypothetical protein
VSGSVIPDDVPYRKPLCVATPNYTNHTKEKFETETSKDRPVSDQYVRSFETMETRGGQRINERERETGQHDTLLCCSVLWGDVLVSVPWAWWFCLEMRQ